MRNVFIVAVCFFYFILLSCATVEKDKNNLVGKEASDISSQDIDADSKGSDSDTDGLSTVYFEYDSSILSEEAKDTLRQNINWLQNNATVTSVELQGHCDSLGSEAYNIGLGRRRAEAVKNFLMEEGISASRLSVISYGEERPFSETDHSKNRRVNFVPMY